jgi:hypothetical protein
MGSKYQLAPIHFQVAFFDILSQTPPSLSLSTYIYIYIPPTLTVQYKMLKRQKKKKSGWTEKKKKKEKSFR